MYDKNDTIVMLFHTRDAAEQFCSELKDRDFDADSYEIISPDDLPQYGRGEHAAVLDRPASGGLMDKIGSFFGFGDEDRVKCNSLAECLEVQGLSRSDADYYESEVRSGSTMLMVKGGDRIEEIRGLSGQGISPRWDTGVDVSSTRTDTDYDYGMRQPSFSEKEHLELREEVAEVERHEVEKGEAVIGKHIVTEHETIDVPKSREELVIERHPVEGRPSASDVDFDQSGEDTITVPLMEEQITIEKRPVEYEEVDIGKRKVEETEKESVTLRREELDIRQPGEEDLSDEEIRRRRLDDRERPAA